MYFRKAPILLLFLVACSSSQNPASGPAQNPGADTPQKALNQLSESDRKALETWNASLEKNCDATEIFGGANGAGAKQLDAAVLMARTGHSLIIRGANGAFAFLGEPTYLAARQDTQYQNSVSVTGQGSYQLKAETHYSGGTCEVSVFGQPVASITLIRSFAITAAYDPTSFQSVTVTTPLQLNPASTDANAELIHLGFGPALTRALKPTESTRKWVAAQLGFGTESADAYLQLRESASVNGSMTLDSSPSKIPFGFGDDGLLGSKSELNDLLHSSTPRWVVAKLSPPSADLKSESNSTDHALFSVPVTMSIAPAQNGGAYDTVVQAMGAQSSAAYDDSQAVGCLLTRLTRLPPVSGETATRFSPAYARAVGPCDTLSQDFAAAQLASKDMIAQLNNRFTGIAGSPETNYQGWDGELRTFVLKAQAGGLDLQATLDPQGTAPIINGIAANARTIHDAMAVDTHLTGESDRLLDMVMDWSLKGHVVTTDRLTWILEALNNTIDPFADSTHQLMSSLAQEPNSDANTDLLKFAHSSVTDAYKDAARAFAAAASGLDADDIVSSHLGSAIQRKYSLEQFRAWKTQLDAAKAFAARDRARKSADEAFFENNLKDLLHRGLGEGWGDAEYARTETIAPLMKSSDFCGSHPSSASGLVDCGSHSGLYSVTAGNFLDPRYGDRYARASSAFQGYIQKLTDQTYFSDRNELLDAFYSPLWKGCDNASFDANLSALNSLIDGLVASGTDFSQRFKLEDQMRTLLRSCGA